MRTIYTHGHIITMDKNQPYAESLCVEDGKIIAVGSYDDLKAFYNDETHVVDLKNKTMLPGFIDAHSHFAGAANAMNQCDLSGCHSFDDIVECLKDFIEKRHIPEGEWVHGCQYDHNFLQEQRHPDIFCLDRVSTKHPIIITHSSIHMGSFNSLGLEILGIDENTPDQSDGKYGRIEGTQKPNGYMEENAFLSAQAKLPGLSVERLLELMKDAQDMYASYGITTVQDGMVSKPLFQLLKHAAMNDLLTLDVVGFIDIIHEPTLFEENKEFDRKYLKHLKLGGYKIFLDGSPQGRTAWMLQPYEGEKEYCGYPIISDEDLYRYMTKATDEHRQLLAHCNGDAACEQYVRVFEKVAKDQKKTDLSRPVMIHAQLVQKQQDRKSVV